MAPLHVGGFKVLERVAWFSLVRPGVQNTFQEEACRLLANLKINLAFVTAAQANNVSSLSAVLESASADRVGRLVEEQFSSVSYSKMPASVLSLFPHRNNPEILGTLIDILAIEKIEPLALGSSPSAISSVLREEHAARAAMALFGPFRFGAYRTSSDWKLARRGKEDLFREVMASYSEERPRVYGLSLQENQMLVELRVTPGDFGSVGALFRKFAVAGFKINFLMMTPGFEKRSVRLFFCIPDASRLRNGDFITKVFPASTVSTKSPVTVFSMHGPHFGDRHGIVSKLFHSLGSASTGMLALSCTVASVSGVILEEKMEKAVEAIRNSFEVPD